MKSMEQHSQHTHTYTHIHIRSIKDCSSPFKLANAYHDACFIYTPLYIVLEVVVEALDEEPIVSAWVMAQTVHDQPHVDG